MNSSEENNAFARLLHKLPEVPQQPDDENSGFEHRKLTETKLRIAESRSNGLNDNSAMSFDEAFSGDLPCSVFYLDKHSVKLEKFKTFDQLSEFILESQDNPSRGQHTKLLERLCLHPVQQIVHFATLGEYLRHIYEKDHLMDVKIEVDGQIFKAHRMALCCFSGYFSSLLLNEEQSKKIPIEVKLLGISAKGFATFLEFVYTGEISVNPDTAADMLIISDFLDVGDLKNRLNMITDKLTLAQAVTIVVKCRRRASVELYQILTAQILRQFSAAAMIPEFLEMDVDTFCRLLASDDLFVAREFEVFQVALRWIVHGGHTRLTHVVKVFSFIRFCHMTPGELMDCVEETHLFLEYGDLRELVLIANWMSMTMALGRTDPFQFPVWSKRVGCATKNVSFNIPARKVYKEEFQVLQHHVEAPSPETSTKLQVSSARCAKPVLVRTELFSAPVHGHAPMKKVDIYVIGGLQTYGHDKNQTTDSNQSWLKFCNLPSPRCHHAVVLIPDNIYLLGGYNPNSTKEPMKEVYRMNLKNQRWVKMAAMSDARMNHCACAANGKIYVFGGIGERSRVLSTAECYDTVLDTWSYIAMMTTPRFAASAATLGNKCYVAGGMTSDDEFTADRELGLVECYNPLLNSWSMKSMLRSPRCYATLVNVNQALYICGGATYSNKLNGLLSDASIDVYNANVDKWSHLTNMTIPRHAAGVTVAGRRIYVIGGISSPAEQVLRSVECYDTVDAKWLPEVEPLPFPSRWICCVSAPRSVT